MLEVLVAFIGALALTPALRDPAHRIGLVDRPSGRKTHDGHIPLVGGIGMVATFVGSALLLQPSYGPLAPMLIVTLATGMVGALDDAAELPAVLKLIAQVGVAILAVHWGGQVIVSLGDLLGNGRIDLDRLAVPFTVFAMVGVMNAINMIDGLDGLAGSVVLIAMGWLACVAAATGSSGHLDVVLLWMGALGAFLLFNLRHPFRVRASVFMGDAGSLALGLTLAWFCVDLTQDAEGPALYPVSALWIAALPVMDAVYQMLRRICVGTSPFASDRCHIHHTLLRMGLSEDATVFVVVGLSALLGGIGVLGWYLQVPEVVLAYAFLAMFASYCAVMLWWRPLGRLLGIPAIGAGKPHRPAQR